MRTLGIASLGSLLLLLLVAGCGSGGPPGGDPAVIEGRWTGDLESGTLPSGSSLVVVDVERAQVGEPVVARVVFGEGAAPAAPTDPAVGWPAGIDPETSDVPVADGFEYASSGGARMGDRVSIDLAVTDLWEPWCALQTPHAIAAGSDQAQCLPNRPWTLTPFECHFDADAENAELPVDCLKLSLCRRTRVCACTTTGGCVPSTTGLTMQLELFVTGDTAVGTILWTSEDPDVGNQVAHVRFTRS